MEPTQETAVRREFTQQPRIPRKGLVGLRKYVCSCFTFLGKTGEILSPTEDTFPFLSETNLDSILKSRDYFANKGQSSQSCGFSSSHVWMWELDYKESWALKNWCFSTMVLENTLESPLDCKEIQPVHPKGDQSWIFIGRTEAETPILWPPDVKSWPTGKDPDAGKDWGQEEKGRAEDEMVGWHHPLNGHGFGWTLGAGDGQGGLACCGSWGCRVRHNWVTELNWIVVIGQNLWLSAPALQESRSWVSLSRASTHPSPEQSPASSAAAAPVLLLSGAPCWDGWDSRLTASLVWGLDWKPWAHDWVLLGTVAKERNKEY